MNINLKATLVICNPRQSEFRLKGWNSLLGELEHLRRTYARLSAECMDLYGYWTRLSNGLDIGAEDYITKPFSTREVIARINRILLRCKKKSIIKIKDISYDMDKAELRNHIEELNAEILEIKNKIQESLLWRYLITWS